MASVSAPLNDRNVRPRLKRPASHTAYGVVEEDDDAVEAEGASHSSGRIIRDTVYMQGGYALCIASIYVAKTITEQAQRFFPLTSMQDNMAAMAVGTAAGVAVFGCAKLSAAFLYAAEQEEPMIVRNFCKMSSHWMLGGAFAVAACAMIPFYEDMKKTQALDRAQSAPPSLTINR